VKSRNAGYREGGKGLWQNGMATGRARKFAGRSAFANRREARVSPGIHSPQRLRAVSQLVYPRSSGRAALQRRVNAGFLLVGRQARRGPEGPLYPDTPTREPLSVTSLCPELLEQQQEDLLGRQREHWVEQPPAHWQQELQLLLAAVPLLFPSLIARPRHR